MPSHDQLIWPNVDEIRACLEEEMKEESSQCPDERMFVPDRNFLRQRILIIGHCSSVGHRAFEVTLGNVQTYFWWSSLEEDVRRFLRNCIHCRQKGPLTVPRPYASTLHAVFINQILQVHYDFLYINKRNQQYSYILVLKDDLSNFVELVLASAADHFVVADALLSWHSRYGSAEIHISDQGTHFTAMVIKELQRLLNIQMKPTVAYSPWANGTVEIVNKHVLEIFRALLSEFQMEQKDWPLLVPLVQSVLNHSPSRRLSGYAPIEIFCNHKRCNPLDFIFNPDEDRFLHTRMSAVQIQELHHNLSESLALIHKEVLSEKKKLRDQSRKSMNKGRRLTFLEKFSEGDYVLFADVRKGAGNKLGGIWDGPFVITSVVYNEGSRGSDIDMLQLKNRMIKTELSHFALV